MDCCFCSNKVNNDSSPIDSNGSKPMELHQQKTSKKFKEFIQHIQALLKKEPLVLDKNDFTKGYKHIIKNHDSLLVEICCKYQIQCDEIKVFQDAKKLQKALVCKLMGRYYKVGEAERRADKIPEVAVVDKQEDGHDEKSGMKSEKVNEEKVAKLRHFFIWSLLALRQIKEVQCIGKADEKKEMTVAPEANDQQDASSDQEPLAMDIWEKFSKKDQRHSAIFAAALLEGMSKHSDLQNDDFEKLAKKFTGKATELIQMDTTDADRFKKLKTKSKIWGNTSILKIAVESSNKTFLENDFCRSFSKKQTRINPDGMTIKQLTRHIDEILECGQVPEKEDFATAFQCIMGDGDNLIAEICHNYNLQLDGKTCKHAMDLQRTLLYLLIGHYYEVPHENANQDPKLYHFFIWSLLAQRPDIVVQSRSGEEKEDMAMKIWGRLDEQDQIYAALFATAVLKALARYSVDEKDDLLAYAKKFNTKASECIDEVYEKDEKKARKDIKNISKTSEKWGGRSILRLAVDSKNLEFLQHPVCKTFLEEEWMGHLSSTMSVKLLLTCLFSFAFLGAGPVLIATFRQPSKDDRSKGVWREAFGGPCTRIYYFFKAPIIRFLMHGITYMVFLGYFSYVLLIQFSSEITNDDIILLFSMSCIFLEELLQILGTYLKEKRTKRCCLDCSYSLKLQFHVRQRMVMSLLNTSRGIWFIISFVSTVLFITGYILKRSDALEAARIVLGFDLILLYIRSLQIFSIHSHLGPKIVMIGHMFKDLSYFIWILMVFVVSYGMAAHSIMYPNSELTIEFFLNLLKRAYWNLYGELLIEELEQKEPSCTFDENIYSSDSLPRCPTASSTVWIPIMMGFYILVSNILLLNLLIAMFSSTYERIQNDSERLWNYQRFFLIRQYKTRWWTPFFFIYFFVRAVMWCHEENTKRKETNVKNSDQDVKVRKNGFEDTSYRKREIRESNA